MSQTEEVRLSYQKPESTAVEMMVVEARSTGTVWVYHKNPWRAGEWSVTHKPSQRRAPVDGLSPDGAEKLALVLASALPKFSDDEVARPTPQQRVDASLYHTLCYQAARAAKSDSSLSRLRPVSQHLHAVSLLSRLREEPAAAKRDRMVEVVYLLVGLAGNKSTSDGSLVGETAILASQAAAAFEMYRDSTRKLALFAGVL